MFIFIVGLLGAPTTRIIWCPSLLLIPSCVSSLKKFYACFTRNQFNPLLSRWSSPFRRYKVIIPQPSLFKTDCTIFAGSHQHDDSVLCLEAPLDLNSRNIADFFSSWTTINHFSRLPEANRRRGMNISCGHRMDNITLSRSAGTNDIVWQISVSAFLSSAIMATSRGPVAPGVFSCAIILGPRYFLSRCCTVSKLILWRIFFEHCVGFNLWFEFVFDWYAPLKHHLAELKMKPPRINY